MSKKLGFALGAGGARGIAHIGFLKAMHENGITPDFIAGSSMGSVVGACYASGMTPDEMYEEAKKLKAFELLDVSFNPLGGGALMRTKKMRKKLANYLGNKTFNELKIPFSAVSVDLITGKAYAFKGDKPVLDYVIASSAIPGVFQPIQKDGKMLVDGVVASRVPVKEVRKMGADVIVAVDVLGKVRELEKKYNMFSLLLRVFDVMDCELSEEKMKKLKPDLLLVPELGEMSQYKFKDIETAFEKGYELGLESVEKIKELIKD